MPHDFFLQPNLKKAFLTFHICVNATTYMLTQHISKQITWKVFILGQYACSYETITFYKTKIITRECLSKVSGKLKSCQIARETLEKCTS